MAQKQPKFDSIAAYLAFEKAQEQKAKAGALQDLLDKSPLAAYGYNPDVLYASPERDTEVYGYTGRLEGNKELFSKHADSENASKYLSGKFAPTVIYNKEQQPDTVAHESAHRGLNHLGITLGGRYVEPTGTILGPQLEEAVVRALDYKYTSDPEVKKDSAKFINKMYDIDLPKVVNFNPDNPTNTHGFTDAEAKLYVAMKEAEKAGIMALMQEGKNVKQHLLSQDEINKLDVSLGDILPPYKPRNIW